MTGDIRVQLPRTRAERRTLTGRTGGEGRIDGLDGVRAVAIIAVLIFHLRPASLRGGYLGVDVFFVVSGFLITTLLVRERRRTGWVDLKNFWIRRARRLLPALWVVVVVSTVLGAIAGNDLLVDIRRQVIGALTFSNNWLEIGAGGSYFNHTSPQLFVTFWSLAVEEQFYLFWPVLLLLILSVAKTGRLRVAVVLGLAAASAVAMALLVGGHGVTRVYYGTDTHAFGLMIGAALALSLTSRDANISRLPGWRNFRMPLAAIAGAGLLALFFTLDGEATRAYRGGILAASLLTAALIAALATAPTRSGATAGRRTGATTDPLVGLFSLKPLVWIGQRSYGIYLWHWPALLITVAFLPAALPDSAIGWLGRGIALAATLLAAAASYRFIETPVRRDGFQISAARLLRGLSGRPLLNAARVIAAASFALIVSFGVALAGAPSKSSAEIQLEAAAAAAAAAANGNNGVNGQGTGVDSPPDAFAPTPGGTSPSASPGTAGTSSTGAPPPRKTKWTTPPTGPQISAYGDSMLLGGTPGLLDRYPGIDLDARPNRQWGEAVNLIKKDVSAGHAREFVIIAAGTNAGLRDPKPLIEALDALGPNRLVVLVNLHSSSSFVKQSNDNMNKLAKERPNVVVADWDSAIQGHPDKLYPDGIHPNMKGTFLFADLVKKTFATATGQPG